MLFDLSTGIPDFKCILITAARITRLIHWSIDRNGLIIFYIKMTSACSSFSNVALFGSKLSLIGQIKQAV